LIFAYFSPKKVIFEFFSETSLRKMNRLKAIIFDFDGVIAESLAIKTEAFGQLYKKWGGEVLAQTAMDYHLLHGGVSRYEKFKYLHREYLGIELSAEQISELGQQYSELVMQKVIDSPYVPEAYEFISSNYQQYDFFVSSGTPQIEMREIVKRKGLEPFFKKVYGSPVKKDVHVREIMSEHSYNQADIIFIGDATADRDAARANGIDFVARIDTLSYLTDERFQLHDFKDFDAFLNRHFAR
jgi:phosphoglycolate phosphatase-like HAD superfamily hydrolase